MIATGTYLALILLFWMIVRASTTVTERIIGILVISAIYLSILLSPGAILIGAAAAGGLAYISYDKRVTPSPPMFAVPTVWNRRVHSIVRERVTFAYPLFPILETLIILSREQVNQDLEFKGVRTRAEKMPEVRPNEVRTETPRSGGAVTVKIGATFEPDYVDPVRTHLYINAGQKDGVIKILSDIVGEAVRRTGADKTWEELSFEKEQLSVEIVTAITGYQPTSVVLRDSATNNPIPEPEDPTTPRFKFRERQPGDILTTADHELFLEQILQNGPSDVLGLGIRVRRMNVFEVQPEGELAKDAESLSREEQQRRSQRYQVATEIAMAEDYRAKDPNLAWKEALELARVQTNPNVKEILIRSGGNTAAEMGATMGATSQATGDRQ